MKLNEKGQEFSVFKLVIAAIVAVAILGVLLSIMGGLVLPGSEPGPEITRVVKSLMNAPGQPGKTNPVTFKQDTAITSAAVAEGTGALGSNQVCFSTGDFEEEKSFEVLGEGRILKYNKPADFIARAQVICSTGTELQGWVDDLGYTEWETEFCSDCMELTDTCCIVAAVRR